MPGYVFKDGGPIPDDDLTEQQINQNTPGNITRPSTTNSSTFNTPTSSTSALNAPSDSHALAVADHEDKGVAQHNASDNVKDLGWDANPKHVPTMVGGLPNSELWMLVRRFDKQMYRVKATTGPLPGGLDLNIVDEDDFSPDKLRSNIERLYMTVIIGLMGFGNHIARLRSWREPRRTMAFAAVRMEGWYYFAELRLTRDIGLCFGMVLESSNTHMFHDPYSSDSIPTVASNPVPSGTPCLD